jgi:hypothetical protein
LRRAPTTSSFVVLRNIGHEFQHVGVFQLVNSTNDIMALCSLVLGWIMPGVSE